MSMCYRDKHHRTTTEEVLSIGFFESCFISVSVTTVQDAVTAVEIKMNAEFKQGCGACKGSKSRWVGSGEGAILIMDQMSVK